MSVRICSTTSFTYCSAPTEVVHAQFYDVKDYVDIHLCSLEICLQPVKSSVCVGSECAQLHLKFKKKRDFS